MSDALHLETTLEPRGPAGAIVLTDAQVAQLGEGQKTFPVQVTVNGTTARLRVARMGGENLLGMSKAVRAELGVEIGAPISAVVALDDAPREVTVPDELAAAFAADVAAHEAYAALAFTHRKEFARWVGEAKKPETRQRRAAETITMLHDGRTR